MGQSNEPDWLESVVSLRDGYEADAVQRFTDRLLRLADSRLPARLKRRVDPEDIVQSAFRSFFARHESGRFSFREAPDVWRLLAAITYHKVKRTIRLHRQKQRDVDREMAPEQQATLIHDKSPTASSIIMMMDLLDKILAKIPEKHREVVKLRLEGYSIPEISDEVGVSSRTVDRALAVVRKVATEIVEVE